MKTTIDTNARRFNRSELARTLHISPRTLDRRRILGLIPKPDELDETGHPLWLDSTVQEVISRRKTA